MSWTLKIAGADKIAPEMRAAFREGVHNGLERIGIEGQNMVVENITTPFNNVPPAVFTGNLAGSVQAQVFEDQAMARLVIGVGQSMGADKYAAPVETGARPHFPPTSALLIWVKRKLGIEDEREAKSVAFLIARKIARQGTRGHEMFSRALENLEPRAVPIMERSLAESFVRHGFGGHK